MHGIVMSSNYAVTGPLVLAATLHAWSLLHLALSFVLSDAT